MKACEYLHRASGMHREESLLSGKCMDDGMYRTKSEISRRSEADSRYEQIRKVGKFLVAMRLGETPVLISNTMVKT